MGGQCSITQAFKAFTTSPSEDLDEKSLLICTNSNPIFVTTKLVGILEVLIYQLLVSNQGLRATRMTAWKTSLKGLLWSNSLCFSCCASDNSYFLVVQCAAAISSPHLSCSRWASCLLWVLVTEDLMGAGNSQVTMNARDCFFVYRISHHIVNSEPSAQPKPPPQLPNWSFQITEKGV